MLREFRLCRIQIQSLMTANNSYDNLMNSNFSGRGGSFGPWWMWSVVGIVVLVAVIMLSSKLNDEWSPDAIGDMAFGTIPYGQSKVLYLNLVNDSEVPWEIEDVKSDCGCISIEEYEDFVGPLSDSMIRIRASNVDSPASADRCEERHVSQKVYATVAEGKSVRLLTWTIQGTIGAWPFLTPRSLDLDIEHGSEGQFQFDAILHHSKSVVDGGHVSAKYLAADSNLQNVEEFSVLIAPGVRVVAASPCALNGEGPLPMRSIG